VASARRESRRKRRLPPNAVCAVCGVSDPAGLKPNGRSILEFNHIPGAAIDPELGATFCRTHHAMWTASQKDRNVDLRHGVRRTIPEAFIVWGEEVVRFVRSLADRFDHWLDKLRGFVNTLDTALPQWRRLPGVYV
jgi:hypothetical protein